MLKCNEVAQNASAYLDGNLPPLSRWRIRLHLAMCENCRRFLEQLRLSGRLLRQHERARTHASDPEVDTLVEEVLAAPPDRRP